MAQAIGHRIWAIAEGYIPPSSTGTTRQLVSHETACILNAGDEDARIEVTVYFADREPAGPYILEVPARRTRHFRFDEFDDPERIPPDTDFSSVFVSSVAVVVQHTRLDTRQEALALLSTIAFPAG
ncbi:MAG: sensory rhodopsin transducer [Rhodomicrobium sp.]